MKFVLSFIFIIHLFSIDTILIAQSTHLKLRRVNPDGWFSLIVPKDARVVERHASVDGGFFITNKIEIDFDYWWYENTPNYYRNVLGNYNKKPILICEGKRKTKTWKDEINGKSVTIQTCFDNKTSEFIYHAAFPKIKVNQMGMRELKYGMFNLTITYKDKEYLQTAKKIVNSLRFTK